VVAGRARVTVAVSPHRLVAGEHGAQHVDGGVAELGGRGEQVVDARRLVVLAALDVPKLMARSWAPGCSASSGRTRAANRWGSTRRSMWPLASHTSTRAVGTSSVNQPS
jgi:hypothetical protein